jgi:hypothetical protein
LLALAELQRVPSTPSPGELRQHLISLLIFDPTIAPMRAMDAVNSRGSYIQ